MVYERALRQELGDFWLELLSGEILGEIVRDCCLTKHKAFREFRVDKMGRYKCLER